MRVYVRPRRLKAEKAHGPPAVKRNGQYTASPSPIDVFSPMLNKSALQDGSFFKGSILQGTF